MKKGDCSYAYAFGTYFVWNDLVQDYIKQIELPPEFFWKRYKISPYDKPMGCYRILRLEDLLQRYRRNHKKLPVIFTDRMSEPADDSALISRTITEELRHEKNK